MPGDDSMPRSPKDRRRRRGNYDNFYTPQNDGFYARFHYSRLSARKQEIRLLKMDLSSHGRHTLVDKVPLYSVANYTAVSYYSGDPTQTASVSINGVDFNAFRNLATAIDQVIGFWTARHPGVPLFLWTDQICINQSDPAEKATQVQFMREIYRRAERVFVSMPLPRDMNPALVWLERQLKLQSSAYTSLPRMFRPSPEDPLPKEPSRPADAWDLMCDLIEHDWWTRAWVYQEFMLAARAYFLFSAHDWIQWDKLAPLISTFLSLSIDQHVAACQRHCDKFDSSQLARRKWGLILGDLSVFTNCEKYTPICPLEPNHEFWRFALLDYCQDEDDENFRTVATVCAVNLRYWSLPVWFSALLVFGLFRVVTVLLGRFLAFLGWPRCLPCSQVNKAPHDVPALQQHMERLRRPGISRTRVDFVLKSRAQPGWRDGGAKLSTILRHARNTRTSQPKDKIYAFLGLVRPEYGIRVDYRSSHSVNSVLTDTARAILQHEENGYDILLDAGTAAVRSRVCSTDDPLPSWVPDWATEEDLERNKFLAALNLPRDCSAGGHAESTPAFEADSDGRPDRVLTMAGFRVDVLDGPETESYEGWCRFHTRTGKYTVMTTSTAQRGDEVWVLQGARWPFVLRRLPHGRGRRVLLAVAGVLEKGQFSGVMFGKGLQQVDIGDVVIV